MFSANYAKPIEKRADLCYTFICVTMGMEKYTLLWILTARTYKIYRTGVDNGDKAADNHLPTYRAERSFAALFCQAFFAKNISKFSKDRHVHGLSPPVNAQVFLHIWRRYVVRRMLY